MSIWIYWGMIISSIYSPYIPLHLQIAGDTRTYESILKVIPNCSAGHIPNVREFNPILRYHRNIQAPPGNHSIEHICYTDNKSSCFNTFIRSIQHQLQVTPTSSTFYCPNRLLRIVELPPKLYWSEMDYLWYTILDVRCSNFSCTACLCIERVAFLFAGTFIPFQTLPSGNLT